MRKDQELYMWRWINTATTLLFELQGVATSDQRARIRRLTRADEGPFEALRKANRERRPTTP